MNNIQTVNIEFKSKSDLIDAISEANKKVQELKDKIENVDDRLKRIEQKPTPSQALSQFNEMFINFYGLHGKIWCDPDSVMYELYKPYDDENFIDSITSVMIDYKGILERQVEALNSRLEYLAILLVKS
jgi:uncharacterized protein YdcH (DUF465 family)